MTMIAKQICAVIIKNLLVGLRNRELIIEMIPPILVALMLSLRKQLTALNQLTPLFYCLAIIAPQRSILISLIEEKNKRYKEVQKIMGLSNKAYQIGWILTGYLRIVISIIIFEVAFLLFLWLCDTSWQDYFTYSFVNLLWIYVIFGFAAMNQIFFIATLMTDSKVAGEVQAFIAVAMDFFIYMTFVTEVAQSKTFFIIISIISPQCAVGFSYVAAMQASPPGANLISVNLFPVNIIRNTFPPNSAGTTLAILMLTYLLGFIYADQVVPNEYGVAKHPLFFLQRKRLTKIDTSNDLLINYSAGSHDHSSALHHEDSLTKCSPSIKIDQLTKIFDQNFKAVDSLTLQLYESQIFCLLGHNGAGKTTAINLLTGMIKKSSGHVLMDNMDLDYQLDQIRKTLGLCNQKDCLYQELSVMEHLRFIDGIKGNQAVGDYGKILRQTGLYEERDKQASQLAGGARRKLSLAMALVGDSRFIFLDEPTSGLDAYSRRSIWEILQKIKAEKRTIILTTHHLDEAEVLADRIGIMSRGKLLAVGTSNYIKKKFGEGYRLLLSFPESADSEFVRQTVLQNINCAQFEEEHSSMSQLSFTVPFSQQSLLSQLFLQLEAANIQIQLKMNTLEEAFIKIGTEEDEEHVSPSEHRVKIQESLQQLPKCLVYHPEYKFSNQVRAMFQRRFFAIIRTNTNYFAILIPLMTFMLGMTIVAYLDLRDLFKEYENIEVAIEFFKVTLLSGYTMLGFCFNATVYIIQPVQEKEYFLKHALHGMGCRKLPYWLGTFLLDYIIYSVYIVIFFVFSAIIDLEISFKYWRIELISFFCFGSCQILMAYIMGFVFNKLETALKTYAVYCFFVQFCMPFVIVGAFDYFYQTFDHPASIKYTIYTLQILFASIFPQYAFFEAFIFISGDFDKIGQNYPTPQVSSSSYLFCYIMLGQSVIACILLILLETLPSLSFKQSKFRETLRPVKQIEIDPQVNDESFPIQAIDLEIEYVLGQSTLKRLTFSIKKKEIFGVIGPNAAGKSTLINTFAGIIQPTRGQALLDGFEPKAQNIEAMKHVGICPQFDCVWENLTVLEHLKLFGRIKGLAGEDLEEAVQYFVQTMQLGLFVNTKAGRLSGGNKRKLCVADALIGGSDILLFDEPSTGVDPISRKFLAQALKRNMQLRDCSALITTHTIDEAEKLSQKIGILIAGEFKCVGSPEELRKKFGSGYQITAKLGQNQELQQLERIILEESNLPLQRIEDDRIGYLTFQSQSQRFQFSKAFSYFERLKNRHHVEDFQISESSLEQIFLLFSRKQHELNEKAGLIFD